jgi:hypothetical protein
VPAPAFFPAERTDELILQDEGKKDEVNEVIIYLLELTADKCFFKRLEKV